MLSLNQYKDNVEFKKTIDDALYAHAFDQTGLIFQMSNQTIIVPKFLTDQDHSITTAQLKWLDDMLIERFGQRWLNRAGGNLYSWDFIHEHLNPPVVSDLKRVIQNILLNYINKWNYEWDAYWSSYDPVENYNMEEVNTYQSNFTHTMAGEKYQDDIIDETHAPASVNISKVTRRNYIQPESGDPETSQEQIIYDRHYTDTQPETYKDNGTTKNINFESTYDTSISSDETLIQGFDSSGGSPGGGATSNTGYNQKEKVIHKSELPTGTGATSVKKVTTSFVQHDDIDVGTVGSPKPSSETKIMSGGTQEEYDLTVTNGGISTNAASDDSRPGNRTIWSADANYNEKDQHGGKDTLTRHGNIGVTTNQQMLTQEFTFRDMYNFIDILLHDIADYISLKIY